MPKRKEKHRDDGHVVSSMNVEGMPWYTPSPQGGKPPESAHNQGGRLSRREAMWAALGMAKALLLIAGVIVAGIVLFVWLTLAWWK